MGACQLKHEVSDDTKIRRCSAIQFNSQSLTASFLVTHFKGEWMA